MLERQNAIFNLGMFLDFKCSQMMYVEPSHDPSMNAYLEKHIDEIRCRCKQFIYLPTIVGNAEAIVRYNRPGIDARILERLVKGSPSVQDCYDEILSSRIDVNGWKTNTPMILRYEWTDDKGCHLTIFPLHYVNDLQFGALLNEAINAPLSAECPTFRYSTIIEQPNYDSRNNADSGRIDDLAAEIRERIEQLQMMGVSDYVIRKMIALPEAKLSPLYISTDLHIILPAYDSMEISMPTLSKVVYFFFLRHPEGLRFKDLIDHREELMQIYYRLSNRDNLNRMEQSIDELTDSTRNSINEKCSRIRAAFVSQFSDELARNYYITGSAGCPKRISLDRSMIIDKAGIVSGE